MKTKHLTSPVSSDAVQSAAGEIQKRKMGMSKYLVSILMVVGLQACVNQTCIDRGDCAAKTEPNPDSGAEGFEGTWIAPDPSTMSADAQQGLLYLSQTYKYLGQGSQSRLKLTGNKLACTNCHLEEGKAAFAGPWVVVHEKYVDPGIYSSRTNERRNIPIRVNGCIARSMVSVNAAQLDPVGPEMDAIRAYFAWLNTGVQRDKVTSWKDVKGQGFIPFDDTYGGVRYTDPKGDGADMDRAANSVAGKEIYQTKCLPCHGVNGEGVWFAEEERFVYPALWGPDSFGNGAGMNRLRTGVNFVRANMPYGHANAMNESSMLTEAESWDVMSYVQDQPRPQPAFLPTDWSGFRSSGEPVWMSKRIDARYGPYMPRKAPDGSWSANLAYPPMFTEEQHWYGPWAPLHAKQDEIRKWWKDFCATDPTFDPRCTEAL